MNQRFVRCGVACVVAVTFVFAESAPGQSSPSPSGATADVPQKVDAIFADVAKADTPGCALGVIRDGQLIYSKGYGQAVIEHGVAITPRTVFDIGSVSKHFTAAAIVLLAQQGKLSLEDDVRKYVPELPDYSKAGARGERPGTPSKLTIRHLLHHTGGVRNYDTLMALAAVDFSGRTGDREALDYIVRQKELNFTPGAEYLYSNSGYFLLSQVVKKASGKTLREFAAEHIFQPLGMKDTQFLDDTTRIVPRRAVGYNPGQGGGFQVEMSGFEQTGDGAVQTTIEDFLLWDRNFYDGRVLGQQGLEWMHTPGVLNDGRKITYAFGLVVRAYKGLALVEHGGAWAGYRAYYLRFPQQKFSIVTLCNAGNANPSGRARRVADVYLGDLMKDDAGPQGAAQASSAGAGQGNAEWKKYAGLYRNEQVGGLLRVAAENDKLMVRLGTQSFEIVPAGNGEFQLAQGDSDFRVRFEPASGGKFRMVRLNSEGTSTPYDALEPFTPSAQQQRAFVGAYYSEEADVTYTIVEREGKLHLRIGKWREMPIETAFRDAFSFPMGQLIFARDARGRVSGFAVQAGRVRNIRFTRLPLAGARGGS